MRSVAVDSETHLIQQGLLTPPIVCGTWAVSADPAEAGIATPSAYLDHLERMLRDPDLEIVGANIAYDFACAANERPHLLPLIFDAYATDRIFDILIAQALIAVHAGILYKDPETFAPIGRYSQGALEKWHLGIARSGKLKTGNRMGLDAGELAAGIGTEDEWRLRYALLDGVPLEQWPEAAIRYPKEDVAYCLAIRECQRKIGLNLHAQAEQARAAWALHLSAVWGIRTDPATVAEVIGEIDAEHNEAVAKFSALGLLKAGGKKNTAEIKRAVAIAYGARKEHVCKTCGGTGKAISEKTKKPIQCKACDATGLDLAIGVTPRTPGDGISTNEDTLTESGSDLLEQYAEIGSNEKLFSTYRPILLQGIAVPINPQITTMVETGRTSYSKPNLQNQPRKGRIRECYVPRPGMLYASVDYGTLELCTLAQTCLWWVGHSAMADAINAGRDIHDQFGARFQGITYDDQHTRRKAGDKFAKDMRQLAKAPNFGLPGGLGAFKLVIYARNNYGISFCEMSGRAAKGTCGSSKVADPRSGKLVCAECHKVATELKKLWFEEWPEVAEYHAIVSTLTEGEIGGKIEIPGPPGNPGFVRGGCGFCDGSNSGFQGLAARGAKAALFDVARESYCDRKSPLWGYRANVFIHDEILGECREEIASEAAHRVGEIMVATMRRFCPDVKITAEPALMRRWLKGAEPVFVDGRLVPWEPKA